MLGSGSSLAEQLKSCTKKKVRAKMKLAGLNIIEGVSK